MQDEYDSSTMTARPNPYAAKLKKTRQSRRQPDKEQNHAKHQ
jgi:hypothetical protein